MSQAPQIAEEALASQTTDSQDTQVYEDEHLQSSQPPVLSQQPTEIPPSQDKENLPAPELEVANMTSKRLSDQLSQSSQEAEPKKVKASEVSAEGDSQNTKCLQETNV